MLLAAFLICLAVIMVYYMYYLYPPSPRHLTDLGFCFADFFEYMQHIWQGVKESHNSFLAQHTG